MSDMDEIVKEFLVESHEGLDRLDRDLVALEQRPRDRELLAGVFRCIHTIKGTCGFLGFSRLESVSHAGENLLSLLRDGKLEPTPEITSALLRLVDAVRQILASIEAERHRGRRRLRAAGRACWPGWARRAAPRLRTWPRRWPRGRRPLPSAETMASAVSESNIRVDVGLLDKLMNLVGELVLARNQILQFSAAQRRRRAPRHRRSG